MKAIFFILFLPFQHGYSSSICDFFFKPYFYRSKFQLLTQIADTFGFELPEVPLKIQKRIKILLKLCELFHIIQIENEMTAYEFCAFLYDFAPKYIQGKPISRNKLAKSDSSLASGWRQK